jgi:hypothetical protein
LLYELKLISENMDLRKNWPESWSGELLIARPLLHKTTKGARHVDIIPCPALDSNPVSQFSIAERR